MHIWKKKKKSDQLNAAYIWVLQVFYFNSYNDPFKCEIIFNGISFTAVQVCLLLKGYNW